MIITIFKIKNNMLISDVLQSNKAVHLHGTRQNTNHNFFINTINTNYGKFKMTYQGPVLWNALPNDLKDLSSVNIFRSRLKSLFLSTY